MSSALHQSRYTTEKTHWGASIWCVRRWPACSKDIRQQYPEHVSVNLSTPNFLKMRPHDQNPRARTIMSSTGLPTNP
jgi:hypothetical protein